MNKGWIKLHRKFLEWEWYDDTNTKVVFLHCLLKANHKNKRWRGEKIERGSFITSLSNLASETGLSVQNVRTALSKLEDTGEINKETTSVNTCISITYYDEYQTSNKVATSGQQGSNKQVTTTKNEKNEKNEKKSIATPPDFDEVKEYFKSKGYDNGLAEKFYNYYQEPMEDRNGRVWKDSNGNTVKSWKQKAIAVWMKEDNKQQSLGDNSIYRS